MDQLVNNAPHY